MATYKVTGAGSTEFNRDDYVGSGTSFIADDGSYSYLLSRSSGVWYLSKIPHGSSGLNYYRVTSASPTPPESGWGLDSYGATPAPTVSLVGDSVSPGKTNGFFAFF